MVVDDDDEEEKDRADSLEDVWLILDEDVDLCSVDCVDSAVHFQSDDGNLLVMMDVCMLAVVALGESRLYSLCATMTDEV